MKLSGVMWRKKYIEKPDIAVFKNIMMPRFIANGHLGRR
jgi:hypothetical protein